MRVKGTVVATFVVAAISFGWNSSAEARSSSSIRGERKSPGAEITVTGEKSDRLLHETITSTTVVTRREIEDQNLSTIYDVLDRTPNVVVDGNRTSFSIRGIDAFNVSGSGEGPLASVYLDGVAIPRLAMASGPLNVFDVEQVEVLRGSQSSLQGRNTLAGAVMINTINPGFDWSGTARLLMEKESRERRLAAALGGAVVDDQLAFRFAGEANHSRGFIHNITTGKAADQTNSFTVRGKLLLKPAAIPDLSVIGGIMHDRHERGAFYSELDPPYVSKDRIVSSDIQDVRRVGSTVATLIGRYDLGVSSVITATSNLSHFHFRSVADADRTALPGQISRIDEPTTTFQQEVRLNFGTKSMEGLVGAFYLRERRDYHFSSSQSLSLSSLGIPGQLQAAGVPAAAAEAVMALYGGAVPIQNSLLQPQLTKNFAAFGDLTFLLPHHIRLRVGLRYDRETQRRTASQSVAINGPLPDPTSAVQALAPIVSQLNASLAGVVEGANAAMPSSEAAYDAWLPLVGLSYNLNKDVAIGGTVRRGYRAGGMGINQQRGKSFSFGPEFTTNYELAFRSAWLDRRLTVNANLFWTEWKDQQVSVQLTPGSLYDSETVNAARSRLYGFELESRANVGGALNIYAGVGFTNAKFKEFLLDHGRDMTSAAGKDFPRAPRWTVSGGASYADRGGPFANINVHWRSSYYQSLVDQNSRDIPARAIVSAKIGWRGRAVSAYFTASNIFDVQTPAQFFIDVDGRRRGALSDPRVLGLALESQI